MKMNRSNLSCDEDSAIFLSRLPAPFVDAPPLVIIIFDIQD